MKKRFVMTPRERIIAALSHKETDKIPVDLGSTESSGITWIPYNKLKNHLNISTVTKVFDMMQCCWSRCGAFVN